MKHLFFTLFLLSLTSLVSSTALAQTPTPEKTVNLDEMLKDNPVAAKIVAALMACTKLPQPKQDACMLQTQKIVFKGLLGKKLKIKKIYWSDGDSGKIQFKPSNKKIAFKLANVDAPEKSKVGSRRGAKCEKERELGYEAKAYMKKLTKDGNVQISFMQEKNKSGPFILYIEINGEDIGELAIKAGHLKPWPSEDQQALKKKPDWCK